MHAIKEINKGKVIPHWTQPKICSLLVISMVLSRFIYRIKTQIWFRNSTIFNEIRFRKRIDLRHDRRRVDDRLWWHELYKYCHWVNYRICVHWENVVFHRNLCNTAYYWKFTEFWESSFLLLWCFFIPCIHTIFFVLVNVLPYLNCCLYTV
jgi:hypothetical protein